MKLLFYPVDKNGKYIDISNIDEVIVYASNGATITSSYEVDGANLLITIPDTIIDNIKIEIDGATIVEDYAIVGRQHDHVETDVTDLDKYTQSQVDSLLNNKEDKSNKGVANGYAGLDSNAKVPISHIPDLGNNTNYVATDRTDVSGMEEGDTCYETSTGDTYIYNGNSWILQADADWENVNLEWANINNKPSTYPPSTHNHDNRYYTETEINNMLDGYEIQKNGNDGNGIINFKTS